MDDQILSEGLKIFAAMQDERMERCIHCGEEWYSIHYRDGVCHSCQKKQLSGRSVMQEKRGDLLRNIALAIVIGVVIIFMWMH